MVWLGKWPLRGSQNTLLDFGKKASKKIFSGGLQLSKIFLKLGTRGTALVIQLKNAPNEVRPKVQTAEDSQKLYESKHAPRIDISIKQEVISKIRDVLGKAESNIDSLLKDL